MNKHTLKAEVRKVVGRKVKKLRLQGLLPAVVYGKKVKSANLQLSASEFNKLHSKVGESTLIYLKIEGEKEDRPVLVREVAVHPVSGASLHVDFQQVDLHEKVTAAVPVKLVGEAPAEKDKLGILVQQQDEVEVEALPTDMPESIEVDVSSLTEVNQAILVKDLKISTKAKIVSDLEQIIAKIEQLAKEEVVEAPVVAAEEGVTTEAPTAEAETVPSTPSEPAS